MFTTELIQEIISKEEEDMLIFAEEFDEFENADGFMNCIESDEDVDCITDHVEEEEIDPPANFLDQLILSFGDEQQKQQRQHENEDQPLSIAEKLRKKIAGMVKKRGTCRRHKLTSRTMRTPCSLKHYTGT